MRFIVLILAGLFLMTGSSPSAALKLNFDCNVMEGTCECKGVWEGADCKAMRKNCKKGTTKKCDGLGCSCDMALTREPAGQKGNKVPKGMKAPTATLKAQ